MSMSVCVCVCVCLFVCEDISGYTRTIFTEFIVHVVYGRDSVLLWQGDEKYQGDGAILGIFFSIDTCGTEWPIMR